MAAWRNGNASDYEGRLPTRCLRNVRRQSSRERNRYGYRHERELQMGVTLVIYNKQHVDGESCRRACREPRKRTLISMRVLNKGDGKDVA